MKPIVLSTMLLPNKLFFGASWHSTVDAFAVPGSRSRATNGNGGFGTTDAVLSLGGAASTTALFTVERSSSPVSEKTSSTDTDNKGALPFEKFDYEDHWYPCIWEEDLEVDEPTKVTIFDVDYVVAKPSSSSTGGGVIAMRDYCTHKGAALSEGRVTSSGYFQCAYHGWSFDGTNGDCVEIPQIVRATATNSTNGEGESPHQRVSATIPSRACTDAVPAVIHQGMVWLFPGGGLEKALLAPPPPSVPEELYASMKGTTGVRDMPVDFSILISNICDPDHGLFAHQAKSFDLYTASLDCSFESFVSKETDGGRGWLLSTKIDSRDKITRVDRSLREGLLPDHSQRTRKRTNKKKKNKQDGDDSASAPWATFHFHAPTFVRMNRVDKTTGETKFVSTFYVCPVGVGRSRFMSCAYSSISVPRWFLFLNNANFLDQDTYLLATQQRNVLAQEADDLRAMVQQREASGEDATDKPWRLKTRRKAFCLPSPTDRIGSSIDGFWDATLARCPNRVKHLPRLDDSGAFLQTPPREFVLDRKTQNLDISNDSRDVVKNCVRTKRAARILSVVLALGRAAASLASKTTTPSSPGGVVNAVLKNLFKTPVLVSVFGVLSLASFLAGRLEKEYYFKYTDDFRRADMKKIPEKIWLDK